MSTTKLNTKVVTASAKSPASKAPAVPVEELTLLQNAYVEDTAELAKELTEHQELREAVVLIRKFDLNAKGQRLCWFQPKGLNKLLFAICDVEMRFKQYVGKEVKIVFVEDRDENGKLLAMYLLDPCATAEDIALYEVQKSGTWHHATTATYQHANTYRRLRGC
jgi:hypothetical protein